jgi:ABC-type sugar transport system ATPase subunit
MNEIDTILDVQHLSKRFPGVQALDDVSFSIRRGEIHSIVGENGAGKSTLTKVVTGIHQRDSGTITYDGRDVEYRSIHGSIEDHIYLVFQELSLCDNLTVAENIFLGKLALRFENQHGFVNKRQLYAEARRHLEQLKIDSIAVDARVGDLDVAQQQLVEIAKALVMKPKLLILDEPTSALTEDEVTKLFGLMNGLRDDGVTIILISHIIEDVFAISDSITVLRDGAHVVTQPKEQFQIDEIVRYMVGRDVQSIEIGELGDTEELLSIRGLTSRRLDNISISLRAGEIVGLMGLQGSGNAELLRCVYGKQPFSGDVAIAGQRVRIRKSRHAIKNGIAYVPADRKTEGILDTLDIGFNLSFMSLPSLTRMGFVDSRRVYERAERVAAQLSLKYSSLDRNPFTLSGGNQQKVVIGKAISIDPRIVLLDDPTRGVDIGAKSEIYKIMRGMAENGRGILFLSTELPELLTLCHRILVFFNGRIVGEHLRNEATEEKLVAQACGLTQPPS